MPEFKSCDQKLGAYPAELERALKESERHRRALSEQSANLGVAIAGIAPWPTGASITVAFLGGSSDLHAAIASTAADLSNVCGAVLDFGRDATAGTFRTWSTTDVEHRADIRVSFDLDGYWSLPGVSSIDPSLTPHALEVGGGPHQRSVNLGGFDRSLGDGWRRTVLRTFLYALGFTHEHQDPLGAADHELRWEDDDGYVSTQDRYGRFIVDDSGRAPGIYTYLSGPPNGWNNKQVDLRLRRRRSMRGHTESALVYRLDPMLYRNPIATVMKWCDASKLAVADIHTLQSMYPNSTLDHDRRLRAEAALTDLNSLLASGELESERARNARGLASLLQRVAGGANAPLVTR